MANVLSPEQQAQVRVLGGLAWSLRRIQSATGVHRGTVRNYLQGAGIGMRRERVRRLEPDDRSLPSQVTLDAGAESNPTSQVTPGFGAVPAVADVLTSAAKSRCEEHRDLIAAALDQWRNGSRSGRSWSTATASPAATTR